MFSLLLYSFYPRSIRKLVIFFSETLQVMMILKLSLNAFCDFASLRRPETSISNIDRSSRESQMLQESWYWTK